MQYQLMYNEKGERLWIPILAGAAIIAAPLWLNNNKQYCNQGYCPGYVPYQTPYVAPAVPQYQVPYPYPLPYPYPVR